MVVASRIMNSGQIAYVDPQSCCDMKAPLMAPIRISGSARENPVRRLIVSTATTKETTSSIGHRASNRSALSDASGSRSRYIAGQRNGAENKHVAKIIKARLPRRDSHKQNAPTAI